MKKSILILVVCILVAGCSSKMIKLDSKYLAGPNKCVVVCKYQAPVKSSTSGGGLIGEIVNASRADAFQTLLTNMDFRKDVKQSFTELLEKNKQNINVVRNQDILKRVETTTNYNFLLKEYDIPLVFELKIVERGAYIKSGALGLVVDYYATMKIEGTLKDLKENKTIWLYENDDDLEMDGNKDEIIADDGKIMKETYSNLIKKLNQQLVKNL
ncbi:MAG: hypothetical protein JW827_11170 [Spirochaetes bacterium]|nr:hypothetical protein [Spirochaetota bacterium]